MLNHIGTQDLKTERLLLRKFYPDDADSMFYNWSNDEEAVKFLSWRTHKTRDDSENFIKALIEKYSNPTTYTWAIVLKKNHEPIGYINFHAINDTHRRGEVSYCIGRMFWNHGYATEALKAAVNFAFFEVGFNRLIGLHDVLNPASGKVLEKAGFRYEGLLRQHEVTKTGVTQDLKIYGILKDYIK